MGKGKLEGKVAVITGAGQGIGRGEALLFAREGAKVVVNDLGCTWQGDIAGEKVADKVVDEIKKAGGTAVPNYDDVSKFDTAKKIIDTAIDKFGKLDILVNNAGVLRDKMIFNMTEQDFDVVVNVNFKGTFNCTRHACAYFRDAHKAGKIKSGRIINTTSIVGLQGNPGQVNYAGAKAAIANLTINVAKEMAKYGVTCNAISPGARTRLTVSTFGETWGKSKGEFDEYDPENIAPMAAYLATDEAQKISGQVFHVVGGTVTLFRTWSPGKKISKDGRWTLDELGAKVNDLFGK